MLSARKMKPDKSNTISAPLDTSKKLPKVRAGAIINKSLTSNFVNTSSTRVRFPSQSSSAPSTTTKITSPTASFSPLVPRVTSPTASLSPLAPRVTSPTSSNTSISRTRVDQKNIIRPTAGFNLSSSFGLNFNLSRNSSSRTSNSGNTTYSSIQRSHSAKISLPDAKTRSLFPPAVKKILEDFEKPISIDEPEDSSEVSSASGSSACTKTSSSASSEASYTKNSSNESSVSTQSKNSLDTDLSSNIAVEARVNRKILDLEITNKSLLAFNQTLEVKVRQQSTEIEQLKKNIRLLSSNSSVDFTLIQGSEVDGSGAGEEEGDLQFQRLFSKLDNLIGDAKEALAYKSQNNGGRVLPSVTF